MKILHLCWGLEKTNGAANIARLIVGEQRVAGHDVELVSRPSWTQLRTADQIWCHCGWYWMFWLVALLKFIGRVSFSFYWLPEACYDPIRLRYHGWKKRLVGPIERWALRHADVLVATCPAEAEWIKSWLHLTDSRRTSSSGRPLPKIEVMDMRRFFNLDAFSPVDAAPSPRPVDSNHSAPTRRDSASTGDELRILYLGRRHPLKGVEYLERAVAELNHHSPTPTLDSNSSPTPTLNSNSGYILRLVSDHTGEELERDWAWCEVLCLPTLSDNFGLVVAEALARGKRVITTDGAPAWDPSVTGTDYGGRLVYLRGYRDGAADERVKLLANAFESLAALSPAT